MTDAPRSSELGKNLAIWTVVGAVVGAVVGGLGFADSGFNLPAAGIGLVAGALVLATLTWLVAAMATRAPEWLLHLLVGGFVGWLFAGVVWEQKFERKWEAQLAGLALGVLLVFAVLTRAWLAKSRDPGGPTNHPHV